jgi:hypothetical protein
MCECVHVRAVNITWDEEPHLDLKIQVWYIINKKTKRHGMRIHIASESLHMALPAVVTIHNENG